MPRKLDLKGCVFGSLTVLRQVEGHSRYLTWECRCECGKIVYADSRHLRLGMTTSCGECGRSRQGSQDTAKAIKKGTGGRPPHDITGRKFGRLTALYPSDKVGKNGSIIWHCRCECGRETDITVSELKNGNKKSCGCLKEESQEKIHDRLHLVDGTCIEWLAGRKARSDNASGSPGIFKKKNGKYTASIGFKKKILYLGTFETFEEALSVRRKAEELVHEGFIRAYGLWKARASEDPKWAEENPFQYDIEKCDGQLVVHNSMEKEMTKSDI